MPVELADTGASETEEDRACAVEDVDADRKLVERDLAARINSNCDITTSEDIKKIDLDLTEFIKSKSLIARVAGRHG